MLFRKLLGQVVRQGTLHLIDPRGRIYTYGDGSEPHCTLRLHSRRLDFNLPMYPSLFLSEDYMDGLMSFEDSSLEDVLGIFVRNIEHLEKHWLVRLGAAIKRQTRRLRQHNPIG